MDEIQKVLIKMGRRDLAQKYYKKVAEILDRKSKEEIVMDAVDNFIQPEEINKIKGLIEDIKMEAEDNDLKVDVEVADIVKVIEAALTKYLRNQLKKG